MAEVGSKVSGKRFFEPLGQTGQRLLVRWGLFIGAYFWAVPNAELAGHRWLKSVSILHDVGGGFVPAMLAAFLDPRKIVVEAVGTGLSVLFLKDVAGLMQRVFVVGIVLWLVTEATHRSLNPVDD